MKILIVCVSIIADDAVGNDVVQQFFALRRAGYDVHLYGRHYDGESGRHRLSTGQLQKFLRREDNIIIYHHAVYWEEGERLIKESRCRCFMRYHNITPPEFFGDYSVEYVQATAMGLEQTRRLVASGRFEHYFANSGFTGRDLVRYGVAEGRISFL